MAVCKNSNSGQWCCHYCPCSFSSLQWCSQSHTFPNPILCCLSHFESSTGSIIHSKIKWGVWHTYVHISGGCFVFSILGTAQCFRVCSTFWFERTSIPCLTRSKLGVTLIELYIFWTIRCTFHFQISKCSSQPCIPMYMDNRNHIVSCKTFELLSPRDPVLNVTGLQYISCSGFVSFAFFFSTSWRWNFLCSLIDWYHMYHFLRSDCIIFLVLSFSCSFHCPIFSSIVGCLFSLALPCSLDLRVS